MKGIVDTFQTKMANLNDIFDSVNNKKLVDFRKSVVGCCWLFYAQDQYNNVATPYITIKNTLTDCAEFCSPPKTRENLFTFQ